MKLLEEKLPFIKEFDKEKKQQFEEYFSTAPDWVLNACGVLYLKKGSVFVRENTTADTIYFVGKGQFKAVDYSVFGFAYDFMRFDAPYAMGGLEVLAKDKVYRTTLQTSTDCIIAKLPRNVFERWIDEDPKVLRIEAGNVSKYMLEQARKSRACIFLQGSERLAYILLDMYERQEKGGILNIKMMQNELAELSGLSTKTIYRSFKAFENNGWISRKGNGYTMNELQYRDCVRYMDNLISR